MVHCPTHPPSMQTTLIWASPSPLWPGFKALTSNLGRGRAWCMHAWTSYICVTHQNPPAEWGEAWMRRGRTASLSSLIWRFLKCGMHVQGSSMHMMLQKPSPEWEEVISQRAGGFWDVVHMYSTRFAHVHYTSEALTKWGWCVGLAHLVTWTGAASLPLISGVRPTIFFQMGPKLVLILHQMNSHYGWDLMVWYAPYSTYSLSSLHVIRRKT